MQPYVPLPGFTVQQTASLQAMIAASIEESMKEFNAALDKHFGPLQSTSPAPKEEIKQLLQQAIAEENAEITVEKQVQKPLYQATVEDDTEDDNSMLDNKSTLSTKARLCTAPASRDPAACLSKALLFASQHALILTLAYHFGYIRCMEGMEATGEG